MEAPSEVRLDRHKPHCPVDEIKAAIGYTTAAESITRSRTNRLTEPLPAIMHPCELRPHLLASPLLKPQNQVGLDMVALTALLPIDTLPLVIDLTDSSN